jgi:hypothetical protein
MIHVFFNHVPNLIKRDPEFGEYLKKHYSIKDFSFWDNCILTKDTIFFCDGHYVDFKILTLNSKMKV